MQEGAKTYVVSSYLPASGPSSRSGPARGGSVLTAAGLRPASILHTSGSARYIPGVQDGLTVRQHEKDRKEREMQNAIRKEAEQELMKKDLGKTLGGQYLELAAKARKAKAKADEKEEHDEREKAREKAKRRKRTKGDDGKPAERSSDSDDDAEDPDGKRRKKPFSTSAVRLIGYDPTRQGDTGIEEDEASRLKRVRPAQSRPFGCIRTDRATHTARSHRLAQGHRARSAQPRSPARPAHPLCRRRVDVRQTHLEQVSSRRGRRRGPARHADREGGQAGEGRRPARGQRRR